MELSDYRERIDELDTELVKIFLNRMEVAGEIAHFKPAGNLPCHDPAREHARV